MELPRKTISISWRRLYERVRRPDMGCLRDKLHIQTLYFHYYFWCQRLSNSNLVFFRAFCVGKSSFYVYRFFVCVRVWMSPLSDQNMLSLILLFSRCSLMFNRKTNRASMLHHYRVTKDRPGLYFFFSSFSGVYISGKHILVLLQTWSFFVKRNISFPFVFLLCIWGGLRQEPAQQQKMCYDP